ncbi:MAG TPA: hypothetical protein VII69_01440, partial [Candidatus Eremiobacteraceae bacterium]
MPLIWGEPGADHQSNREAAMRHLFYRTIVQLVSAATSIAILAGCSSGSVIAAKPANLQSDHVSPASRNLGIALANGILNVNTQTGRRVASFYACPATGLLKYVSDFGNHVIYVYSGVFHGQRPCGQITSKLNGQYGLYVDPTRDDLYVANTQAGNVLVYHRGRLRPYNTYTDPTPGSEYPVDVAVANDGTVIATNGIQPAGPATGSISTWLPGPNGGTFVGNFLMINDIQGGFLTIQSDDTVYFDDLDSNTNEGALWSVSCPAGACGAQSQISGVSFLYPGGLASDSTDDLLAVNSDTKGLNSTA